MDRDQRLSVSSATSSSCEINQDDEYHDDGLPDLVLDATTAASTSDLMLDDDRRSNSGSSGSADNSVVDLILSLTGGRRSVSASDLSSNKETNDDDGEDDEEDAVAVALVEDDYVTSSDYVVTSSDQVVAHAERKNLGFKVTYTDHRKTYVPPKPSYASKVYLSYLCLMPDDDAAAAADDEKPADSAGKAQAESAVETADEDQAGAAAEGSYDSVVSPEQMKFLRAERQAVLQQFAKLSGREQELQRRAWIDELQTLEEDVAILRRKLKDAKKKRSRLKQSIGMARVQSIRSSLHQVKSDLEEKLIMIGEKTEETAVGIEEKIGRMAKKSVQHIMSAVNPNAAAAAGGPSTPSPMKKALPPSIPEQDQQPSSLRAEDGEN